VELKSHVCRFDVIKSSHTIEQRKLLLLLLLLLLVMMVVMMMMMMMMTIAIDVINVCDVSTTNF